MLQPSSLILFAQPVVLCIVVSFGITTNGAVIF